MASLLETLIRPDQDENPERALVAQAANILQVGEFQLLQLAYHDWFGFDIPVAQVNQLFSAYMVHSQVPHWAQHYARKVIRIEEGGTDDLDLDPAVHRYDAEYVTHVPQGTKRFVMACMILATVLVGGIWIGSLTPTNVTSILPPYFEADQLKQGN